MVGEMEGTWIGPCWVVIGLVGFWRGGKGTGGLVYRRCIRVLDVEEMYI